MINFLIQIGFVIAILSVFAALFIPRLNLLLRYGKTLSDDPGITKDEDATSKHDTATSHSIIQQLVQLIQELYVPKACFTHFYILSAAISLLNFFITDIFKNVLSADFTAVDIIYWSECLFWYTKTFRFNSLNLKTCYLINLMIFLHSLRRVLECLFVSKFSKTSKINISHYLAGVFFYSAINLTILVSLYINTAFENSGSRKFQIGELFSSSNTVLWVVFISVQINQFLNHWVLSKTQKYNHPEVGLFTLVSSPHYFDEILIYLVFNIAVLANNVFIELNNFSRNSHNSETVRWNLNYVLVEIWVLVNLSMSALNTHQFYVKERLKDDKKFVAQYAIIPYLL